MALNHGKNWYEGKKSTTFSFNEKYTKPTYKAIIKFKSSNNVYLSQSDFESSGEATSWINDQKSQINSSLSSSTKFESAGGKISQVPLGKTYNDLYIDEIVEMPALFNMDNGNISNAQPSNDSSNNEEMSEDEIKESISKSQENLSKEMEDKQNADTENNKQLLEQKTNEYADKKFEESKTTLDAEMEKLNNNAEDSQNDKDKEAEEESKKSAQNSMDSQSQNNKAEMASIMKKADKGANEIAKHSEEGPEYVSKQTQNLMGPIQNQMSASSSRSNQSMQENQDKIAKSNGDAIGAKRAEEYNSKIKEQAKKQYETLKTGESKSKNIAFQSLQTAKLKIMAMTGINIPI